MTLSQFIKEHQGVESNYALAKRTGLSQQAIGKWRTGVQPSITLKHFANICRCLKINEKNIIDFIVTIK